jgi:uncharacterized RDD family membrane protein YckC
LAERRFYRPAATSAAPIDGREIASPRRRLAAFAFDVLLLLVPSLVVALGVVTAALYARDRPAWDALTSRHGLRSPDPMERRRAYGHIAPLLVRLEAKGLPPEVAIAVRDGDVEGAGQMIQGITRMHFALGEAAERIPTAGEIRVDLGRLIPEPLRYAAYFGVAALYFSVFCWGRRRATLGKRLFKIEVVTLDGRSLGLLESFERFGGYFATIGTFGVGLSDLWRDPNRRLAHDRLANTVVLRRMG